jgi:hypothetical protein
MRTGSGSHEVSWAARQKQGQDRRREHRVLRYDRELIFFLLNFLLVQINHLLRQAQDKNITSLAT